MNNKTKIAFSIFEILVIIAIMGVLAAMIFGILDSCLGEKDNAIVKLINKEYVPESYDTSFDSEGEIDIEYNPPQYLLVFEYDGYFHKLDNKHYYNSAIIGESYSVRTLKGKWSNVISIIDVNGIYIPTDRIE